jgi:HNH endonuclease
MSAKAMPTQNDTAGLQHCRDAETLIEGSDGTGTGTDDNWDTLSNAKHHAEYLAERERLYPHVYEYRFVPFRFLWGYAVWDNGKHRLADGIYKDPQVAIEQAEFYNEEPEWGDREWVIIVPPMLPMAIRDANDARKLLVSNLGLRFDVLKRDNYTCQICGDTAANDARLEVDHKKARSRGGKDTAENLWVLCFSCNRGKGTKDL